MKVTIEIHAKGCAFDPTTGGDFLHEVNRLLNKAAGKVHDNGQQVGEGVLQDANGNTCGTWRVEADG